MSPLLSRRASRPGATLSPDASSYQTLREPSRLPLHAKLGNATLKDVLDEHLREPKLKALLSTHWVYLGLPPSRLSILKFSSMLMSYLSTGAFYRSRPPAARRRGA